MAFGGRAMLAPFRGKHANPVTTSSPPIPRRFQDFYDEESQRPLTCLPRKAEASMKR